MCLTIKNRANSESKDRIFLLNLNGWLFDNKSMDERLYAMKLFQYTDGKFRSALRKEGYLYKFENHKSIKDNNIQRISFIIPATVNQCRFFEAKSALGYHALLGTVEDYKSASDELIRILNGGKANIFTVKIIVEVFNIQAYDGYTDIVVEQFKIPTFEELAIIRNQLIKLEENYAIDESKKG